MKEATVDQILDARQRFERADRRRLARLGGGVAVALHALAVVAFLVGQQLSERPRPPLDFVSVEILPLQALGQPRRTPAPRPEPRRTPEPPAKPPEPRPEPREAAPSLPAQKHRAEPAPSPAPVEPVPPVGSPQGSPAGTSPLGATEVAGLDNPDFRYDYYLDRMLALIAGNWVRPMVEGKIEAVIHFRIGRDGRLSQIELSRSSGFSGFDLAALRAVRSSAPLPPLPASYRQDSLGVTLIVR